MKYHYKSAAWFTNSNGDQVQYAHKRYCYNRGVTIVGPGAPNVFERAKWIRRKRPGQMRLSWRKYGEIREPFYKGKTYNREDGDFYGLLDKKYFS